MKALVLTGGISSYNFIKELKKENIKVLLIDQSNKCFSRDIADLFFKISATNFNAISKVINKYKPDFFLTYSSHYKVIENLSKLSKKYKKKFISERNLKIINNKKKMKNFFLKNNIATPKIINTNKKIKFPIIFKPEVGIGSSNVKKIKNYKEFEKYKKKLFVSGFYEEYIRSNLYHIDGYSTEDKYGVCTILKKNFILIDNVPLTSSYEVLKLSEQNKILKYIKSDLKKILKKLKIKNNFWGIDFFYKGQNIYFIEIGLLHDCYTDFLYNRMGINIYKFYTKLVKGIILKNEVKKFNKIQKAKLLFLYNREGKADDSTVIINKNNKIKKTPSSISDIVGFKYINC